ncbi:DUF2726 domain-containing protein [Aquabacterium sp.]|uniref:DUF2726 domain-containing protein n=1 Tax=Aquabacterium sp. TaxID=1872578 RepID=UPI0035B14501
MSTAMWMAGAAFAAGMLCAWVLRPKYDHRRRKTLPKNWHLAGRPVFNADERALYRRLVQTLPDHVILAKLPLLRFCQAMSRKESLVWYDLLQPMHVGFAICAPNGRVLAAIDVDHGALSARQKRIKTEALRACGVNYVRYQADDFPSANDIRRWISSDAMSQARDTSHEHSGPSIAAAGAQLANTVRKRRAERGARWQDSSFASDSFFAADSRLDAALSDLDPMARHTVPLEDEPPPRPRTA